MFKITNKILKMIVIFTVFLSSFSTNVFATEKENENKYYLGSIVNTGKDNGYSKENIIDENDPHFGWTLGRFYISGYSSMSYDNNGQIVFIKSSGDSITLSYELLQNDINCLNNDEGLSISEDKNGYDTKYGIEKTNFGKGALIIQHTDYQNYSNKPTLYTNYLSAESTTNANTKIEINEEGDYEVKLNYELKEERLGLGSFSLMSTYTNYSDTFNFSIRNGNAKAFPFDISTRKELSNYSYTETGFYLDYANSHYLDVSIKKEIYVEGINGLTEDTRFNKPAKDGEKFTDEGIYTITVKNNYSDLTDIFKIYVGTNSLLKASVINNLSIEEVTDLLDKGSTIKEDGTIVRLESSVNNSSNKQNSANDINILPYLLSILLICIGIILLKKNKKKIKSSFKTQKNDLNIIEKEKNK